MKNAQAGLAVILMLTSASAYGAASWLPSTYRWPKSVVAIHPYTPAGCGDSGCDGKDYKECASAILDRLPSGVDGVAFYDVAEFFEKGSPERAKADQQLKELVEKAHSKGLSAGIGTLQDFEKAARIGADFVELDEQMIYQGDKNVSPAAFNALKAAARAVKPDILVGITEPATSSQFASLLDQGAQPDFIANELYSDTSGVIEDVASVANRYGVLAATFLDDSGRTGSGEGHTLEYACQARNSGVSAIYFNAGAYYDKIQDPAACGGAAAAQPTALSAMPSLGDGSAACPGSDAASCQAYLMMTLLQRQALGIPAVPDTQAAYPDLFASPEMLNGGLSAGMALGGPIFGAPAAAPMTFPALSEQAMNDWAAALQAMFKAMYEATLTAWQNMAQGLWGASQQTPAPEAQAESNN